MDGPQRPSPAGGSSGTPPGKGDNNNQRDQPGGRQELVDVFGQDMWAAAMVVVLLLLGLMSASMTRWVMSAFQEDACYSVARRLVSSTGLQTSTAAELPSAMQTVFGTWYTRTWQQTFAVSP